MAPFNLPSTSCSLYVQQVYGGVDLWDMVRTGWYGMEMRGRCRIWTFRFYEILFSMACANANMIITYSHKIKKDYKAHYYFRKEVTEGLLEAHATTTTTPISETRLQKKRKVHETQHHKYEATPQGTRGDGQRRQRGSCRGKCHRRTTWHCVTCSEMLQTLVFICPECYANNRVTHMY